MTAGHTPSETPPGAPEPSRGRPRRRGAVIAVAAVLALIVGGVCAALIVNHRSEVAAQERRDQAAQERKDARAAAEREAEEREAEEAAAAAQELAERQARFDACHTTIDPFLNALSEVDARLDVGLNQGELSDLVGEASVRYSRMDIDGLGTGACLTAAAKLESAFNAYAKTVNQWNTCLFEDDYCSLTDIDSELQEKWSLASRELDRADRLIDQLDPGAES